MRKLLFNVHLYLALIAGVFVIILGLTGAIMAFEPELDHVLHAKLSYVTPRAHRLSFAQLGAAVQQAYPGEPIGGYLLSSSPDIAAGVSIKRGVVSVDPYTGAVLGVRQGGQDLLGWVHQLHLRLTIRDQADTGKTIVKCAGSR